MLRASLSRLIAVRASSSALKYLKIGSVKIPRRDAKNPALVPAYYGLSTQPSELVLNHLKWLIQKDLLRQDVFLLGVPGKLRTEVVLRYLEATNREFEYLSITRDTTEADIKQRREIRNGTAYYTDLCAVRAALTGRVLVIDGVERAERNVLPILNNLLENREMQLEDGRFLMKHDKYDELMKKYDEATLKKMGIERVSEHFHVVALGLPVPRFTGSTLDPPFRSRFQCRNVDEYSFQEFLTKAEQIAPNVDEFHLNNIVSLIYAYNTETSSSRPRIAMSVVENVLNIWNQKPQLTGAEIIDMCYPAKEILSDSEKDLIDKFKNKFDIVEKNESQNIENFENGDNSKNWVSTENQEKLLSDLTLAFSNGDFTLLGPKGSGKSIIIQELSNRLGFNTVSMVLHQDMNTREFVQRRKMKENGDTVWENSPLVEAAKNGDVCVLDGVEMVHPSVLLSLSQLIYHRRFDLPNGNRLIGEEEFEKLLERDNLKEVDLNQQGIYKIPKSFRVLFIGESQSKDHKWINENILALAPFFQVPNLTNNEQLEIISKFTNSSNPKSIIDLLEFVKKIQNSHDNGLKNVATSLSLRRLIHITRRDEMQPGHLRDLVEKAILFKFLPTLTKETVQNELDAANIQNEPLIQIKNDSNKTFIEMIREKERKAEEEALIPDVLFHDNEQHVEILEDMARDIKIGSHLLLIGNQGVGKNKLTDRFLQLINRPRQYIQLHRDTTVQTLTMQTVVKNGILSHEDSSLVKAAKKGQILVIDEADKAPVHVIAILKGLLDTGDLMLGDGRTMKPLNKLTEEEKNNDKFVGIHPNFRIIMLANRPGFPFLGKNLFAVLGDLFAIHMIDYPSRTSELEMIKKYGPKVDEKILNKLLTIFSDLRDKTDQGLLQYPYSTRELVNIVKHCNEFPDDSLNEVARNVFDFDLYNEDTISTIEAVFQKHGIPLGVKRNGATKVLIAERKSIGEMIKVGKWEFEKIRQKWNLSPIETVELVKIGDLHQNSIKIEKTSTRNASFTEQHTRWRLPITEDDIISDAIRCGDNGLIVALVNPPKLIYAQQLIESEKAEELDLSRILSAPRFQKYQPKIRLAQLGDNLVMIHEELTNSLFMLNLEGKTISSVTRKETLSDQIGAMFSKVSSFWRLTPSNENATILYEKNGDEIFIYSASSWDVNVQNGKMPFEIERIIPVEKNEWIIVSMEGNNYKLLIKEDDESQLELMKQNISNHLSTISAKRFDKNSEDLILIADPFYYLQGGSEQVSGSYRKKHEKVIDPKRAYFLSDEHVKRNIDLEREVTFMDSMNTIVRSMPKWLVPETALSKDVPISQVAGFLEVIDTKQKELCYLPIPKPREENYHREWIGSITRTGFILVPWSNDQVLTVDTSGEIRSFELIMSSLIKSFNEWKRMTSNGEDEKLRMEFEKEADKVDLSKLDEPKLGKIDPNNAPHHGGNQWMGGTGGYNTAGLGGIGGPFRLDAGHDVHQMPEFAKQQVPDDILRKAREIAKEEYAKKLKEINMSEYDASAYETIWKNVKGNSRILTAVIEQLEARKTEREWEKHQTSGDLDDGKLIEGITGEQNIYRRRIDKKPDPGAPQLKPKRLKLCFDVSGSMYRFNGYDKRLQRSLETALMMMVALDGKAEKVEYDIIGHSGDSPCVKFVEKDNMPRNEKDRLVTLKRMLAHTQFCMSGDNTVECLEMATKELMSKSEDYDEMVVILVSDANLERYGIHPKELHKQMVKEPLVNSFVIFIGSLGEQADRLLENLPTGKAFVLKDANELPKIMETIFASTISQ